MESASSGVSLTLPFKALAPNAGTLIDAACPAALTAPCQPIGTAAVTTPLLGGVPFRGKLFARRTGGLPGLSIVFPPPVSLELDGVTTVGSSGAIVESFTNVPDLPLSSLNVTIASTGGDSVFGVGPLLCAPSAPAVSATFMPRNGSAAVVSSVPVTRVNCPQPAVQRASSTLVLPRSQVVRLARKHTGSVAATCGAATCAGTLTLTVGVAKRTGHGKRARVKHVRATVASGRFSLPARSGRSTIRVKLTAAGRALLRRRHLSLKTSAAIRDAGRGFLGSVTLKGSAR